MLGWRHYYVFKSVTQHFLQFHIFKTKNVHPIIKEQLYSPLFSLNILYIFKALYLGNIYGNLIIYACVNTHIEIDLLLALFWMFYSIIFFLLICSYSILNLANYLYFCTLLLPYSHYCLFLYWFNSIFSFPKPLFLFKMLPFMHL